MKSNLNYITLAPEIRTQLGDICENLSEGIETSWTDLKRVGIIENS